jgi:hypothetical protein
MSAHSSPVIPDASAGASEVHPPSCIPDAASSGIRKASPPGTDMMIPVIEFADFQVFIISVFRIGYDSR